MPKTALWILLASAMVLAGCGDSEQQFRDINTRTVTLPDGTAIHAEVKADRQTQAIGMMYRDSLAPDHGMLFIYNAPVKEAYWMHNCKIALDIIWLDQAGKVVEVVAGAPPCEKEARDCPAMEAMSRHSTFWNWALVKQSCTAWKMGSCCGSDKLAV